MASTERPRQLGQDLPVLARLSRRSDGLRRSLHASLVVRVDRVLLDPRSTWKHDVGRRRQVRHHDALDNQQEQLAAAARGHDPRDVADRAVRAGIDHV